MILIPALAISGFTYLLNGDIDHILSSEEKDPPGSGIAGQGKRAPGL